MFASAGILPGSADLCWPSARVVVLGQTTVLTHMCQINYQVHNIIILLRCCNAFIYLFMKVIFILRKLMLQETAGVYIKLLLSRDHLPSNMFM